MLRIQIKLAERRRRHLLLAGKFYHRHIINPADKNRQVQPTLSGQYLMRNLQLLRQRFA